VPDLTDEAAWSLSGTWDLAYAPDRAGFLWAADATPRGQSGVLALVQPVDLGNPPKVQVSFAQRVVLVGDDTLTLEVLPAGRSEWMVIDTQTALTTDWTLHTVDLSAFKGQTIRPVACASLFRSTPRANASKVGESG
jgi:hypothetical protein